MSDDKKTKKITLGHFRSWLEGVEEMQGDDWTPNETQWRKIREKIDAILEQEAPAASPVAAPTPVPHMMQPSAPMIPPGGSSLDMVELNNTPTMPAPIAPIELNPNAPIAKGQGQVKTPDIDTSAGEYESSFE